MLTMNYHKYIKNIYCYKPKKRIPIMLRGMQEGYVDYERQYLSVRQSAKSLHN